MEIQNSDLQTGALESSKDTGKILEDINREISKTSSVSIQTVDWKTIASNCEILLGYGYMDISVMTFYVVSKQKHNGIVGLSKAVARIRKFVEEGCETNSHYVDKQKKNKKAVEWLENILSKDLSKSSSVNRELVNETLNNLVHTLQLVKSSTRPELCMLASLLRSIQKILKNMENSIINKNAQVNTRLHDIEVPKRKIEVTSESVEPIGEIISDLDMRLSRAIPKMKLGVHRLIMNSLNTDLAESLAYKLNRSISWVSLLELPECDAHGTTLITEPSKEDKSRVDLLNRKDNSESLIRECEKLLFKYPLWFDLNMYSATALNKLGPGHQKSARLILSQTKGLLTEFPGLRELRFRNGEKFISRRAKLWLSDSDSEIEMESDRHSNNDINIDEMKIELGTVDNLTDKSPASGLLSLYIGVEENVRSGNYELASFQIKYLLEHIKSKPIIEWSSKIEVFLLKNLLDCEAKLKRKTKVEIFRNEFPIYGRLCLLDPEYTNTIWKASEVTQKLPIS